MSPLGRHQSAYSAIMKSQLQRPRFPGPDLQDNCNQTREFGSRCVVSSLFQMPVETEAHLGQTFWRALSRPPARLALQLLCPHQKAQQLPAGFPSESQNIPCFECLSAFARERFNSPTEILASPRHQPMASGSIPDESQGRQHGISSVASIDSGDAQKGCV